MVEATSVPDEPLNGKAWERTYAVEVAIKVSQNSNLPGREDGPADAYRHLLWAGELTRRFGERRARLILNGHEIDGRIRGGQSPDAEAMDRHNNELGIAIGKGARTWDDVIANAQRLVDESDRSGMGAKGQARWLDPSRWKKNPVDKNGQPIDLNWPKSDWVNGVQREPHTYPFAGEEHRYRDERGSHSADSPPLARGVETWSEDDVRAVMLSRDYQQPGSPDHDLARSKVRAWFEHAYGNAATPVDATGRINSGGRPVWAGAGATGGSVHVSAHSRD